MGILIYLIYLANIYEGPIVCELWFQETGVGIKRFFPSEEPIVFPKKHT